LDTVRAALLDSVNIKHSVIEIGSLSDDELTDVLVHCPELSKPLSNRALKKLLANPYFLDKAAKMAWSDDRPLPESEKAFREKFWNDIIRANGQSAGSMPHRREKAFIRIASQRAKSLSPFIPRTDMDDEAMMLYIMIH
jgi:hypothetical protein